MWKQVKRLLAAPVFEDDEKTRMVILLNTLLLTLVLVSVLRIVGSLLTRSANFGMAVLVNGVMLLMAAVIFFLMRSGRVKLASFSAVSLSWCVLALVSIQYGGIRGAIYGSFGAVILAAGLLLGGWVAVGYATASIVFGVVLFVLESQGIVSPNLDGLNLAPMFVNVTPRFLLVAVLVYLYHRGFNAALMRARHYAADLQAQGERLQQLFDERSRELARRTSYLGASTALVREAQLAGGDLDRLLPHVVDVIGEHFGFYYTGLFLLDENQQWAVLRAASGEGGQRMLSRHYRLPVGVQSVVGYAAARGEHRIVVDVNQDAALLDNPDLPETRSEMAVPLHIRGEILGVLDVQSAEPQAFTEEDVAVLQVLADQVAMAVSDAQLLQRVEASIEAEQRVMGELTREAWLNLLRPRQDLGFYDDGHAIVPVGDLWRPEMETALQAGVRASGQDGTTLALPLRVRDQVIGVIDGRKADGTAWSEDEINLLQAMTEQLNVALEGARLYGETQRRAAREQLTGAVTARIRESLDVDLILQTAARELGEALQAARIDVRLTPGNDSGEGTR